MVLSVITFYDEQQLNKALGHHTVAAVLAQGNQ